MGYRLRVWASQTLAIGEYAGVVDDAVLARLRADLAAGAVPPDHDRLSVFADDARFAPSASGVVELAVSSARAVRAQGSVRSAVVARGAARSFALDLLMTFHAGAQAGGDQPVRAHMFDHLEEACAWLGRPVPTLADLPVVAAFEGGDRGRGEALG